MKLWLFLQLLHKKEKGEKWGDNPHLQISPSPSPPFDNFPEFGKSAVKTRIKALFGTWQIEESIKKGEAILAFTYIL